MNDYATRISAAQGDAAALLALAIELVQEVARLNSIESAAAERAAEADAKRAKDAERKRNVRARPRMSADISGQERTGSPAPQVSLLSPTPPNNPSFPPPPPPLSARVIRVVAANPAVEAVLAHYVGLHPRRKPGPADRKAVEKGLGFGYSAEELCEALTGNANDPWHREKRKHDLSYVLRNNGLIDDFRAKAEASYPEIRDGWFVEAAG